ncbi:unnamed protein product [Notodromas monacha]|uniref:Choline transporter-like protein n=1 Tax=Notodromas monacha TaxID=399045 RepID=A0A7R9BHF9_9CRUS|nr:unnamed protein product [Notodromas monacha]CAG0914177.1 unnamed protein product [Notodromas monacha]
MENVSEPKWSDGGHSRSCTDFGCLIVFLVVILATVFVSAFALVYGKPYALKNGADSFGNFCGVNNADSRFPPAFVNLSGLDMTDRRYLLYFDLENLDDSLAICVHDCPRRNIGSMDELLRFSKEDRGHFCMYDVDLSESHGLNMSGALGPCPKFPIPSSAAVLGRCVPLDKKYETKSIYNIYASLNSVDAWNHALGDVYTNWGVVSVLGLIAVFLTTMIIILAHCCGNHFTSMIIFAAAAVSFAGVVILWWAYFCARSDLDLTPVDMLLAERIGNEEALLFFSIFASLFCVALWGLIVVLFKKRVVLNELVMEAVDCLADLGFMFRCLSFVTLLTLGLVFFLWTYIMLCLATSNDVMVHSVEKAIAEVPLNSTLIRSATEENSSGGIGVLKEMSMLTYTKWIWVKHFWWLMLIALLWVSEFVLAWQQMVVAGAVGQWFFNRSERETTSRFSFSFGIWLTIFKYHLGSVALGSFLVATFKFPRIFMFWMKKLFSRFQNNPVGKCCSTSMCLFSSCFDNFLKFVHHNAYTIVAMQGVDFCPAARVAVEIVEGNSLETVKVLSMIGNGPLFCAKVAVTTLVSAFALTLLKDKDASATVYSVPLFATAVFAYFVSHCLISVYEVIMDTLILCFCEDYTRYKGEGRKSKGRSMSEFACPLSLYNLMTLGSRGTRRNSIARKHPSDIVCQEEILELKVTA